MAAGELDFCLTSVHHYLTALGQMGEVAARFVAIVVQRSPLAAFVASDDASVWTPADLAGRRLGGAPDRPHMLEFLATLDHLGLDRPEVAPMEGGDTNDALARGELDLVVGFVDEAPRLRRQTGIALRAIPVGLDIYASGLLAGDAVAPETVAGVRAALIASLERQRLDPRAGLVELRRRYPKTDPDEALEGWALVEPLIFTGAEPGSMDPQTWERTVSFLCKARGLAPVEPASLYRSEFAGVLQRG